MNCKYERLVTMQCPADPDVTDVYAATIHSDKMIMAEEINEAVRGLSAPMYQEEIAEALADRLLAEVTLTGTHSGITTTVTA